MTRFLGKVSMTAVALAIVVVAAGVAVAQDEPGAGRGGRGGGFGQGGGGRGGRGGRGGVTVVTVASNETVQGLITATADQKTKITEISSKLQEDQQAAIAGAADGGDFAAIQTASAKLVADAEEKVAAALDAAQNTKVLGILANVAGAQSLTNSQIAKNLKLTEEQKTKLAAIAPAGRGGGGGRGGMTPEEQAARDKEYTDVLTADQAAAFAKLKEAQAVSEELATELRPRGRGGRGGAGGGRGGAGGPGGGGGVGGRGQQ
jgi:Spy/CpxP family protein refolding chaperone